MTYSYIGVKISKPRIFQIVKCLSGNQVSFMSSKGFMNSSDKRKLPI